MLEEFNEVIGYQAEKEQLQEILDTLKNAEYYKQLGVSSPQGLLLHGDPGVGKTLMAQCFIEASGRPSVTCRKTSPNGEFVKEIKSAFDRALEAAPSILLLDDMDKFANDDRAHRNSEEFVTVQACIDEVKEKEVFVLATANDLDNLPDSLMRPGRFDRIIEIEPPRTSEAALIVDHYFENKKVSEDVDATVVAALLDGNSCAELENVINQAGMLAGYGHEDCIHFKHILCSCLMLLYDIPRRCLKSTTGEDIDLNDVSSLKYWHEAGHAAMGEILRPDSVVFAFATNDNDADCFVKCRELHSSKHDIAEDITDILISLAGRAAGDIVFGVKGTGDRSDLAKAQRNLTWLNEENAYSGFELSSPGMSLSDDRRFMRETADKTLIEHFYGKAKRILAENRDLLDRFAEKLAQNNMLTLSDIAVIREHCEIKQPSIV